jgi:hypothetical protein
VIPVGIGLRRDRIQVTEIEVDGEKARGHLYARGPYAMTVGRPLGFEGDSRDYGQVRAVANEIMRHIQALALESAGRIGQAHAAEGLPLPPPTWAAGIAGTSPFGRSLR